MNIGEITLLVPEVYPVSAFNPSNFKWTLLVPKILKMSYISPSANFC